MRETAISDTRGYIEIVEEIVSNGYRITSFKEFIPEERCLILRHDIDICLQSAVAVARAEQRKGWRATYFVLLGSEFYNPFSFEGRKALSAILEAGHEIGLHFDRTIYPSDDDLDRRCAQECILLEQLLGRPVAVTAAHRPAANWRGILGAEQAMADRPHAYQPRYFSIDKYVSDSAGYWAFGHPLDHESIRRGSGLQLLTHPYLWKDTPLGSRNERVSEIVGARGEFLFGQARMNFRGYE